MASRPMNGNANTPMVPGSFNIVTGATALCATANVCPLGARTVRFEASQDCYVSIGSNRTADLTATNGMLLRVPTYGQEFAVTPGDLVTAIQGTAAGVLNCTWMLNQ